MNVHNPIPIPQGIFLGGGGVRVPDPLPRLSIDLDPPPAFIGLNAKHQTSQLIEFGSSYPF